MLRKIVRFRFLLIKMIFITLVLNVLVLVACSNKCDTALSLEWEESKNMKALYKEYYQKGSCRVDHDCTSVSRPVCDEPSCSGVPFYKSLAREYYIKLVKLEQACADHVKACAASLPSLDKTIRCLDPTTVSFEDKCIKNKCKIRFTHNGKVRVF